MESRYGLIEAYRPEKTAIARIIFVHGLFGHPYKTWTKQISPSVPQWSKNNEINREMTVAHSDGQADSSSNNVTSRKNAKSVFWPEVLLPKVLPDTQIYIWGYDADIDNFASSASQNTALERNSETLDRTGDSFRQTLAKYDIQIYSSREEREVRKWFILNTMVVDADFVKIGDVKEEVGSIPENHSNVAKFAFTSDIGFKRVSAQLGRWV
ncbi:hypothetical protein MMC14_007803 [Varicellaria rhodocarpa]|nr:hypothetical protein [Varicellaria rhodocarpa]